MTEKEPVDMVKKAALETAASNAKSTSDQALKHIQNACLVAGTGHTLAVLASIYNFRAGDLSDFTVPRLMSFVSIHPHLWQTNCLALMVASLSLLWFMLSLYRANLRFGSIRPVFCLCLFFIGLTINLSCFTTLMGTFMDVSIQSLSDDSLTRSVMRMDAWRILNQSAGQIFLLGNGLYALAGFGLTDLLTETREISFWIRKSGYLVWSLLLLSCLMAFFSLLPQAIVTFFWTIVLFIVWTVLIYVNIDGLFQKRRQTEQTTGPAKEN